MLSPTKKQKATPALFGALVATSENVTLHNATNIAVNSSSSGITVVSSAERRRRYEVDLAAFQVAELELQLAQARLNLVVSRDQLSAGSQTGSVGRLADVSSEVGLPTPADRPPESSVLPAQAGIPQSAAATAVLDPFAVLYNETTSKLQSAGPLIGFEGTFAPAVAVRTPSSLEELFQSAASLPVLRPRPCHNLRVP